MTIQVLVLQNAEKIFNITTLENDITDTDSVISMKKFFKA